MLVIIMLPLKVIFFLPMFLFVNSFLLDNKIHSNHASPSQSEFWENVNDSNILQLLSTDIDNTKSVKASVVLNFQLFTQNSPNEFELLYPNDAKTLANSRFDPNKSTKIITHGWGGTPKAPSCTIIKDAFLKQGDYNVIVVDWSSYADKLYVLAQSYVPAVALKLFEMINFLASNGVKLENTTLIGHSLGAHVMGIAGYYTEAKVAYVVGLDPAGPLFHERGPGSRISSADGQYVEIIHTNAGLLGLRDSVGHRDFFPNGGRVQPGCHFPHIATCSHSRSYELYAEAVSNGETFYGQKCDSYINYLERQCYNIVAVVGSPRLDDDNLVGDFYFRTNGGSPFSKGICGIEVKEAEECILAEN